jgi:hypothetical protein
VIYVLLAMQVVLIGLIIKESYRIMAKLSELAGILSANNDQLDLIATAITELKDQMGDPNIPESAKQQLDAQAEKLRGILDMASPPPAK